MTLALRALFALVWLGASACDRAPFAGAIERRGARVSVWARAEDEVPDIAVAHMDALVRIAQEALGERSRAHRVLVHPAPESEHCVVARDVRRRCLPPATESVVPRDLSDTAVIYGVLRRAHHGHPALLLAISQALGDGGAASFHDSAQFERLPDGRQPRQFFEVEREWRALVRWIALRRGARELIAWYRASDPRMDESHVIAALERVMGVSLRSLGAIPADRVEDALGPWTREALCAGSDTVEIAESAPPWSDWSVGARDADEPPSTAFVRDFWGDRRTRDRWRSIARFTVHDVRMVRVNTTARFDEHDTDRRSSHEATIVACPSGAIAGGFEADRDGVIALPVGRYAMVLSHRSRASRIESSLRYATPLPTHESLTYEQRIPRFSASFRFGARSLSGWERWGHAPARFVPSPEHAPIAPSYRLVSAWGAENNDYVLRLRTTQWTTHDGRATLVLMAQDDLQTNEHAGRTMRIEGWDPAWGAITVRSCFDDGAGVRCEQCEDRRCNVKGVVVIRAPVRPELLALRFEGAWLEPFER